MTCIGSHFSIGGRERKENLVEECEGEGKNP